MAPTPTHRPTPTPAPTSTVELRLDTSSFDLATRSAPAPDEVTLEAAWWGPAPTGDDDGPPVIVLLHEGLGSIAQWREVPGAVHDGTGWPVFAYNRWGYGHSTPAPEGFGVRFMHAEGIEVLPRVLAAAGIDRCVLVGHSDGGSISLIAAGSGAVAPDGVAVIAPHIYVEPECAAGIVAIEAQRGRIIAGLARYHREPATTFAAWNDVWLDPAFQSWDIREYLPTIGCPVLAVQGADDEYATDAMVTGVDDAVPDGRGAILIPDCGHIAHRDQPDEIIRRVVDFVRSLD